MRELESTLHRAEPQEEPRPAAMTARLNWKMDFHTKDFLTSTSTMTGPEAAAYSLLLVLAWTLSARLPADPARIRQAIRYDPRDWRKIWPTLAPEWPITADGTRRNPQQVALWEEGLVRIEKATEKAKAMASARWTPDADSNAPSNALSNAPSNADSNAQASPKQCPSPSPSPSSEGKGKERGASRPLTSSIPTIEEVRKEIAEKGFTYTAERFVAVNEQKGWKGIRDWRAACRAWQANEKDGNGAGNGNGISHAAGSPLHPYRKNLADAADLTDEARERKAREGQS